MPPEAHQTCAKCGKAIEICGVVLLCDECLAIASAAAVKENMPMTEKPEQRHLVDAAIQYAKGDTVGVEEDAFLKQCCSRVWMMIRDRLEERGEKKASELVQIWCEPDWVAEKMDRLPAVETKDLAESVRVETQNPKSALGREMTSMERILLEAVNEFCSCGGAGPVNGCPACKIWHRHVERARKA